MRVFISASTQKNNVGVGMYGTEQDRMQYIADRVKYWLETQKGFTVFRNRPGMTLQETVDVCNSLNCDIFVDNHTNAGSPKAEGTEILYHHQGGTDSKSYKIAQNIYKYIAPLSPGKDRGVIPDNSYVKSLYVIQKTNPPACLIEHFFHTNLNEVNDFLKDMDKYAKAEAMGICDYFGVKWTPANATPKTPIQKALDICVDEKYLSMPDVWSAILQGKTKAKREQVIALLSNVLKTDSKGSQALCDTAFIKLVFEKITGVDL